MATPPAMRQHTNAWNVCAQPVRIDETPKSNAAARSRFLRPNLSLRNPANMAPGHLYRASFHFWASPVYANGDTYVRLRVTYDHQRRWGLEALVSCDQTVTASPALRDSATSIDFAQ